MTTTANKAQWTFKACQQCPIPMAHYYFYNSAGEMQEHPFLFKGEAFEHLKEQIEERVIPAEDEESLEAQILASALPKDSSELKEALSNFLISIRVVVVTPFSLKAEDEIKRPLTLILTNDQRAYFTDREGRRVTPNMTLKSEVRAIVSEGFSRKLISSDEAAGFRIRIARSKLPD